MKWPFYLDDQIGSPGEGIQSVMKTSVKAVNLSGFLRVKAGAWDQHGIHPLPSRLS